MADVIQKIIEADNVQNGAFTITANKRGDSQSETLSYSENTSLTAIEAKYTGRFDDSSYYTN